MKFPRHSWHKKMVILQGKGEQMLDSKDLKVCTKHEQVCWGKARMLSMITQIIEGPGWYFSSGFNWFPIRAQNVDDDHDTIVERFHDDVFDQWWHQSNEWWSERLLEPWVCHKLEAKLADQGQMIWRGRSIVRLAHRRNLCSGKDPVAQLKFSTIMI